MSIHTYVGSVWREVLTSIKGIRNFIVETILQVSSEEGLLRSEKTYINKLDMTLIQVSHEQRQTSDRQLTRP